MAAPGEVRCSMPTAGGDFRGFQNPAAVNAHLGQAEIEDLGVITFGDEHIGGLDVAMDDVLGVRGFERIRHLDGQAEQQAAARADGR